ncbi:hypothetical protein MLD52_14755 [Puniceicoccaceae bacterium K14]|nr:hypothetical protein [Puniceicoccaceae bacterium K14]
MSDLSSGGGASSGGGGASGGSSSLPSEIIESIAISNAKSIGEQPAILANLALANQILNNNLQQQISINQQQAMSQLSMAALSKCIAVITSDSSNSADPEAFDDMKKLIQMLANNNGGATPAQ